MTKSSQLLSLAILFTVGAASATMAATSDTGATPDTGATNMPTATQPTTPPGTMVTPMASDDQQQTAHSPGQPNLAMPGAGTGKGPSTDAGTKQ
jgi:hypothetical protein